MRFLFQKQIPILSSVVLAASLISHQATAQNTQDTLIIGNAIDPYAEPEVINLTERWNFNMVHVGVFSPGTLNIGQGGYLYSGIGVVGMGRGGLANVMAGGMWEALALAVGNGSSWSQGTLNILQGGYVSTWDGLIGSTPSNAYGAVTVSGTWTNTYQLTIGSLGTGTLNIEQGGYVSTATVRLAHAEGSSGTATVRGTWEIFETLSVAASGTGTLSIESGGMVSAASISFSSAASQSGTGGVSTLNLYSGGTLLTGGLTKGPGTASLHFDGGTLRATQDNSGYFSNFSPGDITLDSGGVIFDTNGYHIGLSAALSGAGRLTKTGSGVLTLSGSHGHTGEVLVDHGLMEIDGNLDSSTVTVNGGGTLGGSGKVKEVTLNQDGLIAPGNSAGTLHTGSQSWNGGSGYLWEVDSLTDSTRWDLLAIDGTLTLNPGTERISLLISSLNLDKDLELPSGFEENTTYRFTIATTTGGIIGFSSNAFTIDTRSFGSDLDDLGHFTVSISLDGLNLDLNYTTIPEPGTWSLAIGGILLALAFSRRKRVFCC